MDTEVTEAKKEEVVNFADKQRASVEEIANQLSEKHPGEAALNIIRRLKTGQFKFQRPKEIAGNEKPESEKVSIGASFYLDDFSFLYQIEELICQRCRWYIKNGKEYEQPDYQAIFKSLTQAKLDLTGDVGAAYRTWQPVIEKISSIILPLDVVQSETGAESLQELLRAGSDEKEKAEIDKLSADEIAIMQLMLAKHLYLSKEMFFHWLRLERNKLNQWSVKPFKGEWQLPEYNKFWGDEWEGQPVCWNEEVDESHGLILEQAFKYYSDPHEWAEYESALAEAKKTPLGMAARKNHEAAEEIKSRLRSRLVALFQPTNQLLKAQGYTDKPEPQDISYSQLKTMLDGKRLNVTDSRGGIGNVVFEQITVSKANAAVPGTRNKANRYNLGTAETRTLLKLIAGMAKDGYGYNEEQERNDATGDIAANTGVDHKTAKKWIEFAIAEVGDKSEA